MIEILDWLKRIFAVSRRLLGGAPRYFFLQELPFCILLIIFYLWEGKFCCDESKSHSE